MRIDMRGYDERVKRRALKLFVFLLAGAIINVAVAWGVIVTFPCDGGSPAVVRLNDSWWQGDYGKRKAGTTALNWVRAGEGDFLPWLDKAILIDAPSWSALASRIAPSSGGMVEVISGLPQPCLYMRYRQRHPDTGRILTSFDRELQQASRSGVLSVGPLFLPTTPLWPGFAINTIFYAAIVWFLFFAPGAVRRRVRRKRGQCAACGYSLRGTPHIEKCPECGATV